MRGFLKALVFWLSDDHRVTICAITSQFEICAYSIEDDKDVFFVFLFEERLSGNVYRTDFSLKDSEFRNCILETEPNS